MNKASSFIWRLFDPLVKKIDARSEHFRSLRRPRDAKAEEATQDAVFDETVHLMPASIILNKTGVRDSIRIGSYSHIAGEISAACPGAKLSIGSFCFVGKGSHIWAAEEVSIGNYVLISHLVDIHDNNSHPLDWEDRRDDARRLFEERRPVDYSKVRSAPVIIEDDVWIGFKATIMKGVRIGARSIVASASVVLDDVPPDVVVAGNPARIIRHLDPPANAERLD